MASIVDGMLNASIAGSIHPYYPVNIIIPDYEANAWTVPALLSVFFGVCTVLFLATYRVAKSIQPGLTNGELITIMWFVLSGGIHIIFEGYFASNFATIGSKQTIMGQMWKEYAFSDSRYLTSNSFVLCVEALTAITWGPGCLIVAWLIVHRHPLRYPLQALVSMGEMYGDVIYYATVAFDHVVHGIQYTRPEPFYFWFYFIFMNAIWIVVPACKFPVIESVILLIMIVLIVQSCTKTANAFAIVQKLEASKKSK